MGEHKRIVVEGYPVEKLPDDLRRGLGSAAATATVTIEVGGDAPGGRPQTAGLSEIVRQARDLPKVHGDPVADIRKLRDEWN